MRLTVGVCTTEKTYASANTRLKTVTEKSVRDLQLWWSICAAVWAVCGRPDHNADISQ